MSFYGNITNTMRTHLQFDKIYSNRSEMEAKCQTDGVFLGRYVLVSYYNKKSGDSIITEEELYNENFQKDRNAYKNQFSTNFSGYDSTVWQKVKNDEGNFEYNLIANLNTVTPTFNIEQVVPEDGLNFSVILDNDSSTNIYYNMKVTKPWNFRIKTAVDENKSDEIEEITERKLDIFYNKKYFDKDIPVQESETERDQDNYIQINSFKDEENNEGYKELSIHLPAIGNAISDFWDLVYGTDRKTNTIWCYDDKDENLNKKQFNENTVSGSINYLHEILGMIIRDVPKEVEYDKEAYNIISGAENLSEQYIYRIPTKTDPESFKDYKYYYIKREYDYGQNANTINLYMLLNGDIFNNKNKYYTTESFKLTYPKLIIYTDENGEEQKDENGNLIYINSLEEYSFLKDQDITNFLISIINIEQLQFPNDEFEEDAEKNNVKVFKGGDDERVSLGSINIVENPVSSLRFKEMVNYGNEGTSLNSLLLQLEKFSNFSDTNSSDIQTLQGALNRIKTFFNDDFDNLEAGEVILYGADGKFHSSALSAVLDDNTIETIGTTTNKLYILDNTNPSEQYYNLTELKDNYKFTKDISNEINFKWLNSSQDSSGTKYLIHKQFNNCFENVNTYNNLKDLFIQNSIDKEIEKNTLHLVLPVVDESGHILGGINSNYIFPSSFKSLKLKSNEILDDNIISANSAKEELWLETDNIIKANISSGVMYDEENELKRPFLTLSHKNYFSNSNQNNNNRDFVLKKDLNNIGVINSTETQKYNLSNLKIFGNVTLDTSGHITNFEEYTLNILETHTGFDPKNYKYIENNTTGDSYEIKIDDNLGEILFKLSKLGGGTGGGITLNGTNAVIPYASVRNFGVVQLLDLYNENDRILATQSLTDKYTISAASALKLKNDFYSRLEILNAVINMAENIGDEDNQIDINGIINSIEKKILELINRISKLENKLKYTAYTNEWKQVSSADNLSSLLFTNSEDSIATYGLDENISTLALSDSDDENTTIEPQPIIHNLNYATETELGLVKLVDLYNKDAINTSILEETIEDGRHVYYAPTAASLSRFWLDIQKFMSNSEIFAGQNSEDITTNFDQALEVIKKLDRLENRISKMENKTNFVSFVGTNEEIYNSGINAITVTFKINDNKKIVYMVNAGEKFDNENIPKSSEITVPEDYLLDGWYNEKDENDLYLMTEDFAFSEDITLIPHFVPSNIGETT